MPSTYSNLKIQLMSTGENNTTWGDVTNLNLGTAIEEAISGSADVTFASGNVTLTLTDTNASQAARNMRLNCIGTTGGVARNLIVPAIEKMYVVRNGCADAITIKNLTGTGITVPAGQTTVVFNDGTNVVDAVTALSSLSVAGVGSVGGNFTVSGTLTVSGQTALRGNVQFGATGASNIDSDTNTLYLRGTNVAWQDAGATTTRMYLNSSGNLGIGTISPLAGYRITTSGGGIACVTPAGANFDVQPDAASGANGVVMSASFTAGGYGPLRFNTGGSERVRIDASGNVGIGTASPGSLLEVRKDQANSTVIETLRNGATGGTTAVAKQLITGTANSYCNINVVDAQYRAISNGSAVTIAYDDSDTHYFRTNAGSDKFVSGSTTLRPGADNTQSNGTGSFRWSVVYAATGTINTSDEREKEWRGGPTDAEMKAASAIIREMGFYQWKHAVAEKGADGARYHFGVRAQQVWRIMAEHGLVDPITDGKPGKTPYAFLCWDQWPQTTETRVVKKGRRKVKETIVTREAGSRFGLRVDELTMFLMAAMEARLARLEGGAL